MHNNDPRFVEGTSPVSELHFEEAAELAYFGAKDSAPHMRLAGKTCQHSGAPPQHNETRGNIRPLLFSMRPPLSQ